MARAILFVRRQKVTVERSPVLGFAVQLHLGDQADVHTDLATAIQVADQLRAFFALALPGGQAWAATRPGWGYDRDEPDDAPVPLPPTTDGYPVGGRSAHSQEVSHV